MTNAVEKYPHTLTLEGERALRVVRIFNASRDRVWDAYTRPELIARWWGRGNKVEVERFEPVTGGHGRFVEHGPEGKEGFEGRFREVTPRDRIEQTFEWDGMPGHVSIDSATFEDLGDGRTKLVVNTMFFTPEERDGMIGFGMEGGMAESYAALDRLLAEDWK